MNIMKTIFSVFEKKEIRYIHFKSNKNLDDSFAGKGDFDVLVDKDRLIDVERILLENNGKRHNPEHIGDYPGVDNWLIFDNETGIIYHLHLHYQLATGKALVKDYVVRWSDIILDTRVKDQKYDIYISNPNMELLLLSVRMILKSRAKDWITMWFGVHKIHASLESERKDLLTKINRDTIEDYASRLFENDMRRFVDIILSEKIKNADYRYLTRFVRKEMKTSRRMSGIKAQYLAVYYRACDLKNKFYSRKLDIKRITKKRTLSGGLIVAFVGVDGSGKSTLTKDIYKWISRKIECSRFYMGTGDGKTTLYASLLKSARKNLGSGKSHAPSEPKRISFKTNPKQYLKKLLVVTLIGDVEKNNRKKIIKMNQYRLNGGISLLDRYPQIESPNKNDGPKIENYEIILGSNFITRHYKKLEEKSLSIVKTVKPDIVFRLNITPEVAIARKQENTDENTRRFIEDKIETLKGITFQNANIIDIDAGQPYEQELLEIKRILWRYI